MTTAWLPSRTIKSRDESSRKWRLEDKVWKVGNIATNITVLVVYHLGRGLPLYQVACWSIQLFGHNRHGRKVGVLCPFLGGAGSPSNTMWPGSRPIYVPKWHLDPSSRLATTDMGQKLEAVPPFSGVGELGPRLLQCCQGRVLHPCLVSSCSIQPFNHDTPTLQTGQTGLPGQTTVR